MGATKAHLSYNQLPSIIAADKAFVDRTILSQLHPLFANHKEFAVCLLHRHCDLEDDEIMVADGDITQPERVHGDGHPGLVDGQVAVDVRGSKRVAYPNSWLSTGEPFEYTLDPTPPLPPQLFEGFKEIVKGANFAEGLLGISHITEEHWGQLSVEHTEGKKNVVEKVDGEVKKPDNSISTCWHPSYSPPGVECAACCVCRHPK